MYENMSSDMLEQRMLARMPTDIDKREGSIAYDATAPAALELAEAYIMAQVILNQTFANTADRQFLILRAAEFGIAPYDATYAEVQGEFNRSVDIGARFSYNELYFQVVSVINASAFTYKLRCETAGIVGNSCVGTIIPVSTISGLTRAEITKVLVPGEEEEDTETFRKRFFAAIKSQAFGGNGSDYREKALAIDGVGGVKVYRCWNGGGTVLLVILASDYSIPTGALISEVQETFDPAPQGGGYGLAPIGHIVTTQAAQSVAINVTMAVQVKSGYEFADLLSSVKTVVGKYLTDLRAEWCEQDDRDNLYIRTSVIISDILGLTGITDVSGVTVNGEPVRLVLAPKQVPVLGEVTLKAGG